MFDTLINILAFDLRTKPNLLYSLFFVLGFGVGFYTHFLLTNS